MSISISVGDEFIEAESRHTIHSRERLEQAVECCRQAEMVPVFRCSCGRPLIPFNYKTGFRFRRASRAHVHDEHCGFYRVEKHRLKRKETMFNGMRPPRPKRRAQGLGVSVGEILPWSSQRISGFAAQFLSHAYRTAYLVAHPKGAGGFCMPKEMDFIESVRRTTRELAFGGHAIDQIMAANGLNFKVAVGYIPEGANDSWTDVSPQFVTVIPLNSADPVRNEIWPIKMELLAHGVPMRTSRTGVKRNYWGHFFALGACRPKGDYTDFQMVPAFRSNGVYGRIDSAAEARLAGYFDSLGEDYFRVSSGMDIPLLGDLLGIPADICLNLKHKMDFVRPPNKEHLVRFVEATSYEKGEIAEAHSEQVAGRIRHYLNIGLGRIEVELWQLGDSVPQHVDTVRSWDDLARVQEVLSRNSLTDINI